MPSECRIVAIALADVRSQRKLKQSRFSRRTQPSTHRRLNSVRPPYGEYEGRAVRRRGTCIVGIAVLNVSTADALEFVP